MIVGATAAQTHMLRSILAGLGTNGISKIVIANAPASMNAATGSQSISFESPSNETTKGELFDGWEAELTAGTFRTASTANGTNPIVAFAIPGEFRVEFSDDLAARIVSNPPASTTIADNLAALGLTNISIGAVSPGGKGIGYIVHATTSDPQAFVNQHDYPESDVFGDLAQYEGTYLEIDDSSGNAVLISTQATRVGEGAGWVGPGLGVPPG